MRTRPFLLLSLFAMAASPAVGESPAEVGIRTALQKYVTAFNAGDADAAAST